MIHEASPRTVPVVSSIPHPLLVSLPGVGGVTAAYNFITFSGSCLSTAVYIYVAIPETRGQISVEINQIFAERNKVEIPEKKEEIAVIGPPTPALPAKETSAQWLWVASGCHIQGFLL